MSLLRQSLHDISIYKSTTIPKSVFNSNMQLPGICIQHICTILHQRCQFHALSPEPRNAAAVASKASASAVLAGISKATKNPTLISWAFERRFKPKKRKTKHMLKTWENTDMRLRTLTFSKNKKVQKGLCPALTPRRKAAARASNSASWRQSQGNAKGKPVANPHSASIIDVTNGFTSPLPLSIIDSFDDFFSSSNFLSIFPVSPWPRPLLQLFASCRVSRQWDIPLWPNRWDLLDVESPTKSAHLHQISGSEWSCTDKLAKNQISWIVAVAETIRNGKELWNKVWAHLNDLPPEKHRRRSLSNSDNLAGHLESNVFSGIKG